MRGRRRNIGLRSKVESLRADGLTFREIGRKLGFSRQRANQLCPVEDVPSEHETLWAARRLASQDDPFLELAKKELVPIVVDSLSTLTPKEQSVIRMRFGLEESGEHRREDVGRSFALSRERIRQIEFKALRKLRHPSRSQKLAPLLLLRHDWLPSQKPRRRSLAKVSTTTTSQVSKFKIESCGDINLPLILCEQCRAYTRHRYSHQTEEIGEYSWEQFVAIIWKCEGCGNKRRWGCRNLSWERIDELEQSEEIDNEQKQPIIAPPDKIPTVRKTGKRTLVNFDDPETEQRINALFSFIGVKSVAWIELSQEFY